MRFGSVSELSEKLNAPLIPADATKEEDLENLINESMEKLGGKLDFILHSIGMSVNVRKKREYTDLSYDWMKTTLDVSAFWFTEVMQKAIQLDGLYVCGVLCDVCYTSVLRIL